MPRPATPVSDITINGTLRIVNVEYPDRDFSLPATIGLPPRNNDARNYATLVLIVVLLVAVLGFLLWQYVADNGLLREWQWPPKWLPARTSLWPFCDCPTLGGKP